jgi:hypothetical protein
MKPEHERIALSTAATLLKQVRRVLMHANDGQAAMIKQSIARVMPVVGAEVEAPEPDDESFFGALEAVHGAEFATEARDGPKPEQPPASANEQRLQQELAEAQRKLDELQKPAT